MFFRRSQRCATRGPIARFLRSFRRLKLPGLWRVLSGCAFFVFVLQLLMHFSVLPLLACRVATLFLFSSMPLLVAAPAESTAPTNPPPRGWPANAFLPLTDARVAALPTEQQPAWLSYLHTSRERKQLSARESAPSPSHAGANTSTGASRSQGLKLEAACRLVCFGGGAHDCRSRCRMAVACWRLG